MKTTSTTSVSGIMIPRWGGLCGWIPGHNSLMMKDYSAMKSIYYGIITD